MSEVGAAPGRRAEASWGARRRGSWGPRGISDHKGRGSLARRSQREVLIEGRVQRARRKRRRGRPVASSVPASLFSAASRGGCATWTPCGRRASEERQALPPHPPELPTPSSRRPRLPGPLGKLLELPPRTHRPASTKARDSFGNRGNYSGARGRTRRWRAPAEC